jgi:hypothetical protein
MSSQIIIMASQNNLGGMYSCISYSFAIKKEYQIWIYLKKIPAVSLLIKLKYRI